ncbi:Gfo/Idh/MocA family protein [Neorhodopirellula lusitana]|uniref:Gfo/Idh/MocA family protein n=1 Tax=Neorhodopirellula lusitana TaxID=445327 RepID=UPI00384F1B01
MTQNSSDELKKPRGLIVGLGSIGRRHLKNFRELCPDSTIAVLRRREDGTAKQLGADLVLTELPKATQWRPDWAVIANPASEHAVTVNALADLGTHLLVEKPLASELVDAKRITAASKANNCILMTGYNLRFDEALRELQHRVSSKTIGNVLSIDASVGQYLPDWRPDQDYRTCVSAQRQLGGGALRELSHELDYVQWIAQTAGVEGGLQVRSAQLDQIGDLEIDVEDHVELLLQGTVTGCPRPLLARVHLDFLSRTARRFCTVTGTLGSLHWDGVQRQLTLTKPGQTEMLHDDSAADRNASYIEMSREFLRRIASKTGFTSAGEEGLLAMDLIEQAETWNSKD